MKNYPVMVDTVAALRANGIKSTNRLYIVRSTGDLYYLDLTSEAADDGRLVLEPAWADGGAGRLKIFQSGATPQDEGTKAQNILRLAGVGKHSETVTIGADVYYLTTKDSLAVGSLGQLAVDLHAGVTIKAQGKYTVAGGDAADTETLIINGKTYVLQATLTNVDGNVKIGATPEDTIDNMVAAINLSAGAGTKYAAAMTAHTTVVASKSSTDKLVLTAIIGGTAGNAYTLAGTAAHWTRDAATLGTLTLGVDPSAENVIDALLAKINAAATEAVVARKISASEMQLLADAVGAVTIACTETLATANNAWAHTAMYGGRAKGARKHATISRVPRAIEVLTGNMHFEFDFTPSMVFARIKPTATPDAAKAHDGGITISTTHVKIDNAGSTDWAETDTIEVLAFE